ncbi:MAG: hypothetical protein IJW36_02320 [Clostridia bacterium]|nr:hypothetical protein [Clostridia bacterium]
MKTKSVSSCVLGIIFSIIGAIGAYVFDVVLIFLVLAIKPNPFIMLIPYVNIGAYVISFIGSIICLFNRKVSGIIMIISSIINFVLLIVLCIWLKLFHFLFIVFWLPALITLIIAIRDIKKSKI